MCVCVTFSVKFNVRVSLNITISVFWTDPGSCLEPQLHYFQHMWNVYISALCL